MIAKVFSKAAPEVKSEPEVHFALREIDGRVYLDAVNSHGNTVATVLRTTKHGRFIRFPLPDNLGLWLDSQGKIKEYV